MTETERELDLQIGDLERENAQLRRKLEAAITEALSLRHKLEHIYALATLALDKHGTNDVVEQRNDQQSGGRTGGIRAADIEATH